MNLKVISRKEVSIPVLNKNVEVFNVCTVSKYVFPKGERIFTLLKVITGKIDERWYLNELIDGQYEEIENDEEFQEIACFIESYIGSIRGWHWKDLVKKSQEIRGTS